jgi:hypothetical protein
VQCADRYLNSGGGVLAIVSGRVLFDMSTATLPCGRKLSSTSPRSASLLSASQHGRFPQVCVVIDLLNQEVGDIGSRDETDAP